MKISRLYYIVFLGIAFSAMILLQGCGSSDRLETAPDGSTIEFAPSSFSSKGIGSDTCVNWAITLRYPDTTPFPYGVVTIYGPFAVPQVSASYQFYPVPNCAGGGVNSGFRGQTDKKGVYAFSTLIPELITFTTTTGSVTGLNIFTDNIQAYSGTAFGTAKIEVTEP